MTALRPMNEIKFEIGQKIWWVPASRGYYEESPKPNGFEVEVTKIALKYVTTRNARSYDYIFNKKTMVEKGDPYYAGRAFLSQADYAADDAREAAWAELRLLMVCRPYSAPPHFPHEKITEIIGLLKEALHS